jgi:hypothetical protein
LSMNDFRLDDFEPPSFLLRFALRKTTRRHARISDPPVVRRAGAPAG